MVWLIALGFRWFPFGCFGLAVTGFVFDWFRVGVGFGLGSGVGFAVGWVLALALAVLFGLAGWFVFQLILV